MLDLSLAANAQLKAEDDRGKLLGYCSMFTTTYALGKNKWLRGIVGLEERGSEAGVLRYISLGQQN
jgi:hypothetical protein